ncbi:MAG TPA: EAL domain-containing protein [Pseudomonadales bacterium]|nr:EAL domain-containing protein [Pseudomonadales bacterium]
MMVDDEPILMEVIQSLLEERGYRRFVTCNCSRNALAMIAERAPDVLLLDLVMPEVSGFEILEALRRQPSTRHLAVIVLTSSAEAETKLRALELGATDFLAKPVDPSELALRLRNTLRSKAYQDRLTNVDDVTGLANRKRLRDVLEWLMRKQRLDGDEGYLLLLGLDNFKAINDALGPAFGDEVLRQLASRLEFVAKERRIRGGVHIARAGGDEFALVLRGGPRQLVAGLAGRILRELTLPFEVAGNELFVNAAIGVALASETATADELLQKAGVAEKAAKMRQRERVAFYSAEIDAEAKGLLQLENDLRHGLGRDQFQLYFQPKVDVRARRVVGMEALIRWFRDGKEVPPCDFIPLAERTGLIIPIGEWVIAEACRACKELERRGIDVKVSVNVSAHQIVDAGLVPALERALKDTDLMPAKLVVEITETVVMDDAELSLAILHRIRDLGITLSIDDFGTGYSSLSYLKRLPIGELKIDRAFLGGLPGDDDDVAIVRAVLALAASLGLTVTAEGAETAQQVAFLVDQQCDQIQGFYFSRPLSFVDFEVFCRDFAWG